MAVSHSTDFAVARSNRVEPLPEPPAEVRYARDYEAAEAAEQTAADCESTEASHSLWTKAAEAWDAVETCHCRQDRECIDRARKCRREALFIDAACSTLDEFALPFTNENIAKARECLEHFAELLAKLK